MKVSHGVGAGALPRRRGGRRLSALGSRRARAVAACAADEALAHVEPRTLAAAALRRATGPTQATSVDDPTVEIAVLVRRPARPGAHQRDGRRTRWRRAPTGAVGAARGRGAGREPERLSGLPRRGRGARTSRPRPRDRGPRPGGRRRRAGRRLSALRSGRGSSRSRRLDRRRGRARRGDQRRRRARSTARRTRYEAHLHRAERPQRLCDGDRRGRLARFRSEQLAETARSQGGRAGRAGRAAARRLPGGAGAARRRLRCSSCSA